MVKGKVASLPFGLSALQGQDNQPGASPTLDIKENAMTQLGETITSQPAAPSERHWLRVLISGALLFIIATVVLFVTDNPNLYPTVILVGNFLVPVVFVA